MTKAPSFFIPEAVDPRATWRAYVEATGLDESEVEPLFGIAYLHGGNRYEVRVGEPRKAFPRKTGPRGGYRANAGYRDWSSATGTVVRAIMRTPTVVFVWSTPPYGGWANPSMIGLTEVETVVGFAGESDSGSGAPGSQAWVLRPLWKPVCGLSTTHPHILPVPPRSSAEGRERVHSQQIGTDVWMCGSPVARPGWIRVRPCHAYPPPHAVSMCGSSSAEPVVSGLLAWIRFAPLVRPGLFGSP